MMLKTQMRATGVALFLIGIITLVGYMMYVVFLSGEKLGTYTIQEFDGSIVSFGGFRMTSGSTQSTHTVGPLVLSPDMNPLRLNLKINQRGGGASIGSSGLHYEFELLDRLGNSVWKRSGGYSDSEDSGSKTVNISLGVLDVEQAGEYVLLCDLKDKRTFKPVITKAEVAVRKNVARANKQVYILGGAAAIVGFVMMMIGAEKKIAS